MKLKTCNVCGTDKALNRFGRAYVCNSCHKQHGLQAPKIVDYSYLLPIPTVHTEPAYLGGQQ